MSNIPNNTVGGASPLTASRSDPGRLRVLHIVLNLHQGGLERILIELANRLNTVEFESHVLTLEFPGSLARTLDPHVNVHVAKRLRRSSMIYPAGLIRQIRSIAPDVVHTHSGVWYKASLAARRAGVPALVHTDHGRPHPDPWHHRLLDRVASYRTDVVVAVSQQLGSDLSSQSIVAGSSRIAVITNGVDTDLFRRSGRNGKLRTELDIPHDVPVIGSIGRLDHIKGYDVMLQAFACLLDAWRGPAMPVLVIAGDGPEMRALKEFRSRLGLTSDVRLIGWRNDISELLDSFDLFTMASRSEGTSVSLLEAMSSQLCPVVTDVGGNAAILGPRLAHRLCPPENVAALASAWHGALADDARRRADAAEARRRVVENYSIASMLEAHERMYRSVFRRATFG